MITHDGEVVGVTQSATLDNAERMVRDYVAVDTGADPGSFAVIITPRPAANPRRRLPEVVGS